MTSNVENGHNENDQSDQNHEDDVFKSSETLQKRSMYTPLTLSNRPWVPGDLVVQFISEIPKDTRQAIRNKEKELMSHPLRLYDRIGNAQLYRSDNKCFIRADFRDLSSTYEVSCTLDESDWVIEDPSCTGCPHAPSGFCVHVFEFAFWLHVRSEWKLKPKRYIRSRKLRRRPSSRRVIRPTRLNC